MQISDSGIALIKEFEGCILTAYRCQADKWSIGYGHTGTVDGKKISSGMVIEAQTAERLLRGDIVSFEHDVNRLVKVPLTQGQFDALVSFAYNLGSGSLSRSTLLRKLNAGDYPGAADQFPLFCNAGGKKSNGLVRRRAAEREVFLS